MKRMTYLALLIVIFLNGLTISSSQAHENNQETYRNEQMVNQNETLANLSDLSSNMDTWFTDYYFLALDRYEIIPKKLVEEDFRTLVTREEFCEIIILAQKKLVGKIPTELRNSFIDSSNDSVNAAAYLGFVSGYDDGTFQPSKAMTRQEIFKVIYGFMTEHYKEDVDIAPELMVKQFHDKDLLAQWSLIPTAYISYLSIIRGDNEMKLNPTGNTSRAEAIVMMTRVIEYLIDHTEASEQDRGWNPDLSDTQRHPLFQIGFNPEKYEFIFGDKEPYQSAQEALLDMTKISIPVWTLLADGTKQRGEKNLIVHKGIADVVEQIFVEIFEGQEQFPIKDVGGFAWRSNVNSEHRLGLAIDINSNENYMVKDDKILSGTLWEPGVNPYSIPAEGEVVTIFQKYGFAWGGNAWQSNQDYMHFSYFGN